MTMWVQWGIYKVSQLVGYMSSCGQSTHTTPQSRACMIAAEPQGGASKRPRTGLAPSDHAMPCLLEKGLRAVQLLAKA